MSTFKGVAGSFQAVPLWVWLIFALTQVVNVAASASRLFHLPSAEILEGYKGRMPEDQALIEEARQKHREFHDRYQRSEWTQVVGSSILGSALLGLGFWRWRSGPPQPAST
jgi:hypothetical protein